MKVLITGGTGFVGGYLVKKLIKAGHEVNIVTRNPKKYQKHNTLPVKYVGWDPEFEELPREATVSLKGEKVNVVINLQGENISAKRWSQKQKDKIYNSRIHGTKNLVQGLERHLIEPLDLFISTSAVGIYPSNTDEELTEESTEANNFLAGVCKDWEKEANKLTKTKRTLITRVGVVFGNNGGALEKLMPIFKLGGGGPIGAGKQIMSWIHVKDLVNIYLKAMENENYSGTINAVGPSPVSNSIFTKAFGKAVQRPAFFPVPPFMLKIIFGEMSCIILDSQKVLPKKLNELGHEFLYPEIYSAMLEICNNVNLLGKPKSYDSFEASQYFEKKKIEQIFEFFCDPHNLERITPPFLGFKIVDISTKKIEEGTLINYKLRVHGVPFKWRTLIKEWSDNKYFIDLQLKGPYKIWHHKHSFTQLPDGVSMEDKVDYEIPFSFFTAPIVGPFIKKDVRQIFDYRTEELKKLII